MIPHSGVLKIVRFNWPWYVAAAVATVAGIALLRSGVLPAPWSMLGAAGLVIADYFLLASLAVSHYVYDRSAVSRGGWLDGIQPATVRHAAVFHAGQDEASGVVARILPLADVEMFDFYDPARNGSPSLARARASAGRGATPIPPDRVPLTDGALDLGLVVFAAHEIRLGGERAAFFRELARVVSPSGRILIVEHLRDGWNFLAYGPGAFHFLSRTTWHRSFADGGLRLLREARCTPFVRIFELGKAS